MIQKEFKITEVLKVAHETYLIGFDSPEIAALTIPGQFVNIKVCESFYPLLRRPMSICDVEGDTVRILFNVVGRGTAVLAQKRVGDKIDVLGPLGHGFDLKEDLDESIIVAGGLGVAPFPLLTKELSKREVTVKTFVGARNASRLAIGGLLNVSTATDDGSAGYHGSVVELLKSRLTGLRSRTRLFACGPIPMLHALQEFISNTDLPCDVSIETAMACGIGICQGCPVECANGDRKYKLACKDGPVFDIRSIVI